VSDFLESQEEGYEAPPVPVDVPNGGALLVRETDYSVSAGTSSTVLLDSVSLTARCGEIVAIVGPSGSGKSTLLSLIAGANHPSQGSITVAGFSPVVTGTEAWNSIVQYCPQEPFFRSGTLKENFEAVCPGISEARIHELCSRVGLDLSRLGDRSGTSTMLGERGARISGGERARLAIARTLALNPRVLLLDEPTAALDDESTDHLIATLLGLKRDHCIVVTTYSGEGWGGHLAEPAELHAVGPVGCGEEAGVVGGDDDAVISFDAPRTTQGAPPPSHRAPSHRAPARRTQPAQHPHSGGPPHRERVGSLAGVRVALVLDGKVRDRRAHAGTPFSTRARVGVGTSRSLPNSMR